LWLQEENVGQEVMIEDLTVSYHKITTTQHHQLHFTPFQQSFEDSEKQKKDDEEEEGKPDPLTQLITTFCRGAMTERSGALQEDPLYMSYAEIVAKSCGEEEEEGGEEEDEE
jgi:ryanodine receptor 2